MEKCGYPYEDEHISIIEIGGKHFEHFIELFNGNNVRKKVLCLTDNDFKRIDNGNVKSVADYQSYIAPHINALKDKFRINNLAIKTQGSGGRTFEDELFITNIDNADTAKLLLKIAVGPILGDFIDKHGILFSDWLANKGELDGRLKQVIEKIEIFNTVGKADTENANVYGQLFFAWVFAHYADGQKGSVALDILSDKDLISKLKVPDYICGGIKWLWLSE
jgi:hypothetical protein